MRATGFKRDVGNFRYGGCRHPPERQEFTYRGSGADSGDRVLKKVCTDCGHILEWDLGPRPLTPPTVSEWAEDVGPRWASQMSADEARSLLSIATASCQVALAALRASVHDLEEAQQILSHYTWGGEAPELVQAHGLLAEATQGVTSQQSTVEAAASCTGSYSARL
jgi:hypothetical protein